MDFDRLSQTDIDRFKKDHVWLAFLNEVATRRRDILRELEFGKSKSEEELTMNGINLRQGELVSLRWFTDVFDIQLEKLEYIAKKEESDETK